MGLFGKRFGWRVVGPRLTSGAAMAGLIAAAAASWPAAVTAQDALSGEWAATWQASPEPPRMTSAPLTNQTLRQIVHVSIGGNRVRVRFTNEFGDRTLNIGGAQVALAGAGNAIVPGTGRVLTFDGRSSIAIPPSARIVSDPVDLPIPPLSNLAISIYVPATSGAPTEHFFAMATAYLTARDATAAVSFPAATPMTKRMFLSGVEVPTTKKTKVVVALGDSLTEGFGSTVDANNRWPDLLSARLNGKKGANPVAVVNAGIGGNRLLHDFIGPNALSRFDRDVLSQPRVTHLIVLIGVNDFGLPGGRKIPEEEVTTEQVIHGFRQMIGRAHAAGIRVIAATLPPFGPIPDRPGYSSPASQAKRDALNQWIRTSRVFDGVVDFDAALRDPQDPKRMLPTYDSGDHLNPNDAGYKAMADAVDLRLFN